MILELKRQGLGVSAIARQTGLDRKTVRKYLKRGLEAPVYGPRDPRDRLPEGYRHYLQERLSAFPGLSVRRLHREIKEMGYSGAYSTLTEYLRLNRPDVPRQFERRFETLPGEQAQADFAEFQESKDFEYHSQWATNSGWPRRSKQCAAIRKIFGVIRCGVWAEANNGRPDEGLVTDGMA